MSLYTKWSRNGPSGFGYGSTAEQVTDGLPLNGKRVLVTGCNSGLGYETARVLSIRGADIIGTARNKCIARAARTRIGDRALALPCDLSDPESIHACVAHIRRIDLRLDAIICNAGVMALPRLQLIHGYESQFFINHIGHFMLVTGLLENLASDGRVVVVSSVAYRIAAREGIQPGWIAGAQRYRPVQAYGRSKLANLLFAKELARRFEGTERTANAVHPGISMATNLIRNVNLPRRVKSAVAGVLTPLILKTPAEAAATACYVAVHPATRSVSGRYFADCNIRDVHPAADDPANSLHLWEASEQIVATL
jgi:NAD(P)-dependent dehydrogenase (short-subunit alcohol dehydrogenase family)